MINNGNRAAGGVLTAKEAPAGPAPPRRSVCAPARSSWGSPGAYTHHLQDEWYQFRDEALREVAVGWLEANGIPYQE